MDHAIRQPQAKISSYRPATKTALNRIDVSSLLLCLMNPAKVIPTVKVDPRRQSRELRKNSTTQPAPSMDIPHHILEPLAPSPRYIGKWPDRLRRDVLAVLNRRINDEAVFDFLQKQNWPKGLIYTYIRNCKKIPFRFIIVDDSGSMITKDVKTFSKSPKPSMIESTRWDDLKQSLSFLAELSEATQTPCEFRLLNGADPVIVGMGDDNGEGLSFAKDAFDDPPAGMTPLCCHINTVVHAIQSMADILIENNQRVAIVIMTDGIATDGDVTTSLRPLQTLPTWLVIRLCTSDQNVIDFWNAIDAVLELDVDVIDDFFTEAKEIKSLNPWLTYGEPLQHLREFGVSAREFDLMDEVSLGMDQIRHFCRLLFTDNQSTNNIPHPEADWNEFIRTIRSLSVNEAKIFCPVHMKLKNWIDIRELQRIHSNINASIDDEPRILTKYRDGKCLVS